MHVSDDTVRIEEEDIQREQDVLHPERKALGLAESEEDPGVLRQALSATETGPQLVFCTEDFKLKDLAGNHCRSKGGGGNYAPSATAVAWRSTGTGDPRRDWFGVGRACSFVDLG